MNMRRSDIRIRFSRANNRDQETGRIDTSGFAIIKFKYFQHIEK